ncbi:MAG: hypothetical protein Q9220_003157 [cf. Caloplaca sp. 1 TL-2023]
MPPTGPLFARGNLALITGGASGVGFAVAKLCRSHGMDIALIDINADALEKARKILTVEADGSLIKTYAKDVSKLDQWHEIREDVERNLGSVDFLMLNAGIGLKGEWEDTEYFHKIMDTNLFGVINGISTFLPQIRQQPYPTAIVITGSKQGITNPPGNPAYNASKAAIKSLAEQLSYDLRSSPTSVHLLVPGWTFTGLTGGGTVKEKPDGAWAPEQVTEYLEQKMGEKVFYIICPDNDVTVEKDRKRMMWSVGDIVNQRPPLSRWRDEFKAEAEDWMAKQKV